MNLFEHISAAKSLEEKAVIILDYYQSKTLQNDLEPMWMHKAYELLHKFVYRTDELVPEELNQACQIIASHGLEDGHSVPVIPGRPNGPTRIMHEGWKAGTATWVFMGRNENSDAKHIGNGWVVTSRKLPPHLYAMLEQDVPDTLWIAYNLLIPMSLEESTHVGPSVSYPLLIKAIEELNGNTTIRD